MSKSFKYVPFPSNKGLGEKLFKDAVGVYVGYKLVGYGNRMSERRKKMAAEQEAAPQEPENTTQEYEYVLYENGVTRIVGVVSDLLDTIVGNGLSVDEELLERSRKLLNTMNMMLDFKNGENNGTQA